MVNFVACTLGPHTPDVWGMGSQGTGSWGVENPGCGKHRVWLKTLGVMENRGYHFFWPHYYAQHLGLKHVSWSNMLIKHFKRRKQFKSQCAVHSFSFGHLSYSCTFHSKSFGWKKKHLKPWNKTCCFILPVIKITPVTEKGKKLHTYNTWFVFSFKTIWYS